MYMTKQMSWPVALIALGAMLALTLSLSVPKAGAVTIDELMAQINALQAQLVTLQGTTGGAATACTFTKSLFLGVSDPQVKCLQQYLNKAGYAVAASGAGSKGSESNYYGSLTRAAVAKWQAAMNVSPAAGYFGLVSRTKYSAVAGTTGGTTGGTVTPPVGGGLSVGLSATTQASRTIVAGAANMSFGKFTFTTGSDDVTVTMMKFTKSGISADAEVGSAYLYDADSGDYLAQYSGLGSGVLTFNNASGLFTVKAGMTKNINLRLDVSSTASNNHTMAWGLNAATDVTSNASSVSGTFPAASNAMTFVTVSNPAIATLTSTKVTTGSSVNAGTTGYLAGSFTLASANSAVLLDRIVLIQNGSLISSTDVGNIKLVTTGGQQLGAVLPNLKSDGTGTFVMSPAYEIPSGQTVQVNVYADILAGVNRTMKFNVLNLRDIQARDKTYNIGVNPSASVAMTSSDVLAGTLTVTLDPSSPTGNIAPGQTNLVVGKFKVVSYGEQVKVLFVPFRLRNLSSADAVQFTLDWTKQVDNVYLVDDAGNQIGTTITDPSGASAAIGVWDDSDTKAATFGTSAAPINYLIPANTTRVWSLKLDVMSTATGTISANLQAGTSNYQGQVSLTSKDTTAVAANKLTVTSNPFQAKLNSAFGTGNLIKGQSNAKIGSFVLSASSAEGINVSTISVTSSTTFPFANLLIKVNGVQFGTMTGSLAVSTAYTFSGSAPVAIAAGGSITVDVYADVLSSATGLGSSFYVTLSGASAVGLLTSTTQTLKSTGGTAVSTTAINGQSFTVNTTGGTLTIAKDSSTPASYQVVMNSTGKTLGIWRFTADGVSDISITDMTVTDVATSTGDPSNLKASWGNLQWYKSGVAINPVVVSGTASTTTDSPLVNTGWKYAFHFTSPVVIPQNSGYSLELRGDVPTFASGGAQSNSTHTYRIEQLGDVTALSTSGSLTSTISGPDSSSGTAVNTETVVRTKLSVATTNTYGTGNTIATSGHAPSASDVVAVLVFTNSGNDSITINTVSLKMAGATLATLTYKLIDDDTGSTWGSASPAETSGLVLGMSTTNGAGLTYAAGTSTVVFKPLYVLSGGATKKVRVQTDSTGLTVTAGTTNGSLLQIYLDNTTSGTFTAFEGVGAALLNNVNAIGWKDGTTDGINLEAKVLPLYSPAIRY